MLGIIGAMDKEVDALRRQMTVTEEKQTGFSRFTSGTLWDKQVCLAQCGVGKVHAALCAQAMIMGFGVSAILNIGVAGALRPSLGIGDIVVADSAVQHDADATPIGALPGMVFGLDLVHFPCDPALSSLLKQAAEEAGLRCESGAIAQCCYEMQVPYAAVRAISDTRDGDEREYMEKALFACACEEKLLRRFMALYAWEEKHHG